MRQVRSRVVMAASMPACVPGSSRVCVLERQLELVPTFAAQLGGAKVLANAHAVGDVDGDDATELLFGSVAGDLVIYKVKGERLVKWRSCCVDGSVTAICVDASASSDSVRRVRRDEQCALQWSG